MPRGKRPIRYEKDREESMKIMAADDKLPKQTKAELKEKMYRSSQRLVGDNYGEPVDRAKKDPAIKLMDHAAKYAPSVQKKAAGGRIDGCAQRGKTKGKMR